MGNCQKCEYFSYTAGLSFPGIHTEPTCKCAYADVSWRRQKFEIRKPAGIKCNYKPKEMTCIECNHVVKNGAIYMVVSRELCICKKCHGKADAE